MNRVGKFEPAGLFPILFSDCFTYWFDRFVYNWWAIEPRVFAMQSQAELFSLADALVFRKFQKANYIIDLSSYSDLKRHALGSSNLFYIKMFVQK